MEIVRRRMLGRDPLFQDRREAGVCLARELANYRGRDTLVLGIPRGGVPVAAAVAQELNAELDVVVARKVGAPQQPELAMGAVTANGGLFLDTEIVSEVGVSEDLLATLIARQREEAQRREERFRAGRPVPQIEGRAAIVVDDGLATGATMRAAMRAVRKQRPARLVAAVPVGSGYARDVLREEADEVICLFTPEPFWAVGLYYDDFAPVEDADVQRILEQSHAVSQPT